MKTKIIIYAFISILLTAASLSTAHYYGKYQEQKEKNDRLEGNIQKLVESYGELSDEFREISKQKTYSITLAPNIENRVLSTFGSTKNVTLQYYFTMDGNRMELKPDSVYEVRRVDAD